jgi:NADH dehydrogenase [ubiquinone] 1 alpha subcomplex assembly factor 5
MASVSTYFAQCLRRHRPQPLLPLVLQKSLCLFSTEASSATHAFDRSVKKLQRDNAARSNNLWRRADDDSNDIVTYDYLREEIALRLVDRLDDIRRDEGFPLALDIGAGAGYIHKVICSDEAIQGAGGIGGVRKLVQLDSSSEMLHRDEDLALDGKERCDSYRLVADEEATLPFPDGTFDLVISSASMHWINNLPKVFSEVRRVLKPDGCFMFAMIGGTTLAELRASMVLAELEREGGVSPHVGPFVEISDVGNLLQRAGFALPTIDTDTLQVAFPNAFVLMEHLQRMGENNAGIKRRDRTPLDTFLATACIYDNAFAVQGLDDEVEIEASVQVIYAIGWTPHESQQMPLKRGTATLKVGEMVEHHKSD